MTVNTMDFDDIDEINRYEYVQECPCCTMDCKILTQEDSKPEYYTYVYVKCRCGEYLQFELPVN